MSRTYRKLQKFSTTEIKIPINKWINELNRKLKTIKETQLAKDYFKKSSIPIVIREKNSNNSEKITSAQSEWLLTGYNKCWKGYGKNRDEC